MSCLRYRLLAAICLVILIGNAFSAESHAKSGFVFVNGVAVLEFKTRSGVLDPNSRALAIARSLAFANSDDAVDTVGTGKSIAIKVGTSATITVTQEEATAHGLSVARLADRWANTIRDALSLPSLKFAEDFYRLPIGTVKDVSLVGSLSLGAVLTSSNEAIVKVKRTELGFEMQCNGVGDAQILAESGNARRSLNIYVRAYSASFPQTLTVEFSGNPANGSTVSAAIDGALKTRVVRLPTAKIKHQPIQADALGVGKSKSYAVYVRASTSDAFDRTGIVNVTVRNLALPEQQDAALWYSNYPEAVHQTGSLFAAFLKPSESVRFLYHHINVSTQPLLFRVEAVNESDETVKILVAGADAKPDVNPVRAGMDVAKQFFHYSTTGSAEAVTIPPHSTIPISFRRLSPKETASGLCTLKLLEGSKEILVRADALPPFDLSEEWSNATYSPSPWREVGFQPLNDFDRGTYEPSDHIYPNPYKGEEIRYDVGGRFGSLLIGQKPISGQDHSNNLDGNYGVLYTIRASLRNPTDAPADVEMVFESSAGYTGGLFVIDGEVVQTRYLGPKAESRVAKYHLAPGASRNVEIKTIPISGGAYPATLTFRPIEAGK